MLTSKTGQALSVEQQAGVAADFLWDPLTDLTGVVLKSVFGAEWATKSTEALVEQIFVELLFFQLHLGDRLCCEKMVSGKNARDEFVGELLPRMAAYLTEKYWANFVETYNARQSFYGAFRSFTGDPARGTLFWEFAKKIVADTESSSDVLVLMELCDIASKMLREIDDGYTNIGIYSQ